MENYLENTDFIKIREILDKSKKIIITTHMNPDGDAIGASLAMFLYLKKRGFVVRVMIPDPYPEFLGWLPGANKIMIFEKQPDECKAIINESDLIICVDFNTLNRLNHLGEEIRKALTVKILIDHHLYPGDEFPYKISYSSISSTSELVYDFISGSGHRKLIDKPIAECLYTGIATDTGSFSYSCNYVKTYLITAELIRLGIDGEHIHRLIYDTYSESRLRLLGFAVSHGLTVLPEFHAAYIVLTKEDLMKFNYQVGDTEGVVNYALSIKDINLAALFMERDDYVKVSFRSKGNFSVDRLAREHFGGGGHKNASGANCAMTIGEAVQKFKSLLPKFREYLNNVYNN